MKRIVKAKITRLVTEEATIILDHDDEIGEIIESKELSYEDPQILEIHSEKLKILNLNKNI